MDNRKRIIFHLIKRIGILLFGIASVLFYYNFIYDPHRLCSGDNHRHTDGAMGIFFLGFFLIVLFYLGLLIEIPFLRRKKENNLANINLGFILISLFIALGYIVLINLNR